MDCLTVQKEVDLAREILSGVMEDFINAYIDEIKELDEQAEDSTNKLRELFKNQI